MKIEIKSQDCADHDPIEEWVPEDKFDVNLWMNFTIGPIGFDGGDNFQAHIITKSAISDEPNKKGRMIIIDYFNFDELIKVINSIFKDKEFSTWDEATELLNKSLYWEYENYKEY
jgi:hypothetical protein